jgi:hypothetical protein
MGVVKEIADLLNQKLLFKTMKTLLFAFLSKKIYLYKYSDCITSFEWDNIKSLLAEHN